MLNFIKRNFYRCSAETKFLAYISIVRPLLEYGSAVWDPYWYTKYRDVTIMCCSLGQISLPITAVLHLCMLEDLQWPSSLQHWWYVTRLKLFYNIVNSSSVLSIPHYFTNTTSPSCHHNPFHFKIPFAKTDHYKCSYFSKSIRHWSNLPTDTIES